MFTLPTLALGLMLSEPAVMFAAGLVCPAEPVPVIELPVTEQPRNVRPWKPKPPEVPPVTNQESQQ